MSTIRKCHIRLTRTRESWEQQKADEKVLRDHIPDVVRLIGAARDVAVDVRHGVATDAPEVKKEFLAALNAFEAEP